MTSELYLCRRSVQESALKRSKHNKGAVLNTDSTGLAAYKKRKAKFREIDQLKEEVTEIKALLQKIFEKLA